MASRNAMTVPITLLFSVGIIYPLLFTMNRIAVDAGTPPVAFTFWQTFAAAIILLVAAGVRREWPQLAWVHLRAYFVIGLLCISAPVALLTWLAPKLPTGILAVVVIMSPPLTYLFALAFRLETLRPLAVAGILCGVAGILLMVVPEFSLPEPGMVWWLLLALLAPASFAMTNNLAALLAPPESPILSFASGIVCAATIMLAPMMIGLGDAYVIPGPSTEADLSILGAAAVTCLMYVSFLIIVRAAGPVFFSQFNYVVVVAGLGWGVWFHGEEPTAYVFAAAALMILGVGLLIRSARRVEPAAAG